MACEQSGLAGLVGSLSSCPPRDDTFLLFFLNLNCLCLWNIQNVCFYMFLLPPDVLSSYTSQCTASHGSVRSGQQPLILKRRRVARAELVTLRGSACMYGQASEGQISAVSTPIEARNGAFSAFSRSTWSTRFCIVPNPIWKSNTALDMLVSWCNFYRTFRRLKVQ